MSEPSPVLGALPRLTLRGRCFLAAGVVVVGCAVLLGQGPLVRIGLLAILLPLVSWLAVRVRPPALRIRRVLSSSTIPAGSQSRVELFVAAGRGSRDVVLEEHLPYALGARPRFTLWGAEQRLTYTVRADLRGRFALGPATTRRTDPFGLVTAQHSLAGSDTLVVTPRVVPLPAIHLGGRDGSGHRTSAPASGSAEDASVRDYRRGDELRRVHWRTTARVGELMVRREDHPSGSRATVLVDNRAAAHAGHGLSSSLETAVEAAASIAAHLSGRGYSVRLATASGPATSGGEPLADILERLAVLTADPRPDLAPALSGTGGPDAVVVGVLAELGADDLATLRGHGTGRRSALLLDTSTWSHRHEATDPSSLAAAGWRTVRLGRHDALAEAWRGLAPLAEVRR